MNMVSIARAHDLLVFRRVPDQKAHDAKLRPPKARAEIFGWFLGLCSTKKALKLPKYPILGKLADYFFFMPHPTRSSLIKKGK